MALNKTIWPTDIPPPDRIRSWIATLYTTVDSTASDSGTKLASLYTADAIVYGMHGRSEGSEAIIQSRASAWDVVERRCHEVLQVYTANMDYSDILIIGKLTVDMRNGNQVVSEFIARILFAENGGDDPKARLYQIWADSAPWTKAMASK